MKAISVTWASVTWAILGGAIVSGCQSIVTLPSALGPFPSPPMPTSSDNAVKVTRVVSGHTIEVQPTDSMIPLNQTLRLIGIQAPSHQQEPWGPDAQAYLEDLLLGQTVQISFEPPRSTDSSQDTAPVDTYGRQWAYIWLEGQLVNQQLLADGIVLTEERSPQLHYSYYFKHAQHRARILGLGIWNPKHPLRQTPEDFRQSQE